MSEATLGQLIDETAQRDAIHVAIAPVVAGEALRPGQHVSLNSAGEAMLGGREIGIVDPFLVAPVKKGQRFYLCLYPRSVTGMRHHWSHPSFTSENLDDRRSFSEMWLRVYAKKLKCYEDPDEAFANLLADLRNKELTGHGTDLYGRHDLDNAEELREHAEAYLGISINWNDFQFSCSC